MSYRGPWTSRSIGNTAVPCNRPTIPGRVLSMEEPARLESFKAYDVRGKVPEQLNAGMAELIGRAYAELVHPARVVVGHDVRLTSPEITAALSRGLVAFGGGRDRHRPGRHRGGVPRDVRPGGRRRHHGHRQPQSPRVQRDEVHPGAGAAHQLRHRAVRHRGDGARRARRAGRRGRQPRLGRPGGEAGHHRADGHAAGVRRAPSHATSTPERLRPLKVSGQLRATAGPGR